MNALRADPPPGATRKETLDEVRKTVRGILTSMPGYRKARPEARRRAARAMVDVAMNAADLLAEEAEHDRAVRRPQPMASAQAVGDAGRRAGDVMRNLRDAVDFPTFVKSLITGTFDAIAGANVHQFERLTELLEAVSAAGPALAAASQTEDDAARWAAARLPGLELHEGRLRANPDADLTQYASTYREALGASASEVSQITDDELSTTLLPLVRRKMARDRQSMLAKMVNLGLQRIVVDQGRIHASMDLRVDAHELAERRRQQRFDTRVNTRASANFMAGPWGARADMSATVGYVKNDAQYSKQEMRTQAGLRSSVDLAFRTEQVPLDRLATPAQRASIATQAPTAVTVNTHTPQTGTHLAPVTLPSIPAPGQYLTPPTPPEGGAPASDGDGASGGVGDGGGDASGDANGGGDANESGATDADGGDANTGGTDGADANTDGGSST